jgi:hypothetical protein
MIKNQNLKCAFHKCVACLPSTEAETSSQAVWRSSPRTNLCDSRVSRAVTHSQPPGRGECRARTPLQQLRFSLTSPHRNRIVIVTANSWLEDELGSTCGCVCWRACLTIKRGVSSASSSVRCTKSVAALVCLGSTRRVTLVFGYRIHYSKTHGCLD